MKEIKELLKITQSLRDKYDRSFSLDGRLVGDIGEILVSEKYGICLHPENKKIHDGYEITTGREVQIKASFKNNSYFPHGLERIPNYFLSVNIKESGDIEELFNGPSKFIYDHYIIERKLKSYKNSYYKLSPGVLRKLNAKVPLKDKINLV